MASQLLMIDVEGVSEGDCRFGLSLRKRFWLIVLPAPVVP
jgi:hypothetical protein